MFSYALLRLALVIVLFAIGVSVTAQAQAIYEPYYFGRLAGNGPGSDDGAGRDARFYDPEGVAADGAGNVYVADYKNHTIRKIAPGGAVSTLAGVAGEPGSSDGAGSAARFRGPTAVAVGPSGTIYVADSDNGLVRKITSTRVVTTLADSAGRPIRFAEPSGVAVDAANNVYVTAYFGHTVSKVSPDGVATIVAGADGQAGYADGTAGAARFSFPNDVAVDSAGTLYVADTLNHAIRKITPDGSVSTFAGLGHTPGSNTSGSNDGVGTAARFFRPFGVEVDRFGTVFVADTANHTIRRITPDAVVTTFAGTAGNYGIADGQGSAAEFALPGGVAVDPSGVLYVNDADSNTIRRITPDRSVTTFAGHPGGSGSSDGPGPAARFNSPHGAAVDSTHTVYVADTDNHTIRKITPDGVVSTLAGVPGARGNADGFGGAARFQTPQGVAADSAGNVYVADTFNNLVRKVTPEALVTTLAGSGRSGSADGAGAAAEFAQPRAVAVDSAGNVYVADGNSAIRKITPAGVVSTLARGRVNGAEFFIPTGIAVDASGNVYVADSGTNVISRITPEGAVSTVAGSQTGSGSADGPVASATFNRPSGLAVDGVGNIYVTEEAGKTIRKISPAGTVTTLGGAALAAGHANGTGPTARFRSPWGIAVGSDGRLYIADAHNHTIRVGQPAPASPQMANISTRVLVEGGDNVLIGGFVIVGTVEKTVLLRGVGPSLPVATKLGDPSLELYDSAGQLIAFNNDWNDAPNREEIRATQIPPANPLEPAILARLNPGAYTAVVRGASGGTGAALVEAYAIDGLLDGQLANISTRGVVRHGDDVMIAGFIATGAGARTILVRALGPSIPVEGKLSDPMLEVYDANGTLLRSNDNWRSDQEAEIRATTIPPPDERESAIIGRVTAAPFTAIVRSVDGTTGIGLVEVFALE